MSVLSSPLELSMQQNLLKANQYRRASPLDFSSINIWVIAAFYHKWEKGRSLHHDPTRHPHATREFQLWFVEKGCVEFHTEERQWWVNAGEACLIPMGLERDISALEDSAWWSVRLGITVFNKFSLMSKIPLPAQWRPDMEEHQLMKNWMAQIYREQRLEQDHHRLVVNGLATALLGVCWPHLCPFPIEQSIHSELPSWLVRTLQRIGERPDSSIAELARAAHFSPAQFRRSFRRYIGSTPHEYLTSKRLETAKYLLAHTDSPLAAVAERIGFYDAAYFSRIFKKHYGISPTRYRASC